MERYSAKAFDDIRIQYDIPFAEVTNRYGEKETLHLDIYAPNEAIKNRRVLFFLHGGGFVDQPGCDKQQSYIITLCMEFARYGYVCVSPDYCLLHMPEKKDGKFADVQAFRKLIAGAELPAAQEVLLAREFLAKNADAYGIDPENYAVIGGSAGGMTANAACRQPGKYRCMVSLWGASPITVDAEKYVPTLIVHGTKDESVPYHNAQVLYGDLQAAGIPVQLITLEGAGHTAIGRLPEYKEQMLALFNKTMR